MCSNIIALYIFLVLKVVAILVLPILLIIFRKKSYFNILMYIDIFLLLFFALNNVIDKNACVYNSNLNGIKLTKANNQIKLDKELHSNKLNNTSKTITPELKYKTYNNNYLYYFNQNQDYMNDIYYECSENKIYMNTFGSSITSLSIAISTLYDKSINPIQIFDYYIEDNENICPNKITIERAYKTIEKRYGALSMTKINSNQVEDSIKSGGLVIAELSANSNSKLTCDSDYIVIYNIGLDGKLFIADPALPNNSYICPYSSRAYGNIIDSNNMENSYSLDEINSETISYYLIKKV